MNLLVPFTILILSWSIDTTDPDIQRMITYLFLTVHALAAILFVYIFICIWRRGDQTPIAVKDAYTGETEVQKHWEYDCSFLRDLFFTKVGMSAAVSMFVATRFGVPFPLLLQCLNNPKAIYESQLFKIYVLGHDDSSASGESTLVRPWKDTSMVPEWMRAAWMQSEKDSEAVLERHSGSGNGSSSSNSNKKRK